MVGLRNSLSKKIIDFCLSNKPNYEGCDLVDIVYVLNRCSKFTNHKKMKLRNILRELKK